jgi:hypothetical protein
MLLYTCHQRPAACRSGGLSAPKLLKIPELSASTKVSKKALNPPFLQTAVSRSLLFFYLFLLNFLCNNSYNSSKFVSKVFAEMLIGEP